MQWCVRVAQGHARPLVPSHHSDTDFFPLSFVLANHAVDKKSGEKFIYMQEVAAVLMFVGLAAILFPLLAVHSQWKLFFALIFAPFGMSTAWVASVVFLCIFPQVGTLLPQPRSVEVRHALILHYRVSTVCSGDTDTK